MTNIGGKRLSSTVLRGRPGQNPFRTGERHPPRRFDLFRGLPLPRNVPRTHGTGSQTSPTAGPATASPHSADPSRLRGLAGFAPAEQCGRPTRHECHAPEARHVLRRLRTLPRYVRRHVRSRGRVRQDRSCRAAASHPRRVSHLVRETERRCARRRHSSSRARMTSRRSTSCDFSASLTARIGMTTTAPWTASRPTA